MNREEIKKYLLNKQSDELSELLLKVLDDIYLSSIATGECYSEKEEFYLNIIRSYEQK